jgi:hypothetical protein
VRARHSNCINGLAGSRLCRFRTGGSPGFVATLTLAAPTTIAAVALLVRRYSFSTGYAGIRVQYRVVGSPSTFVTAYESCPMYGAWVRGGTSVCGPAGGIAQWGTAAGFAYGATFTHYFGAVQTDMLRVSWGSADQVSDQCVSFDAIYALQVPAPTALPTLQPTAVPTTAAPTPHWTNLVVSSASWFAADSSPNRESSALDVSRCVNMLAGGQLCRYRTGGSPGFTAVFILPAPATVLGVSLLVRREAFTTGYAGLRVRTSASAGGPASAVQTTRCAMYGNWERGATSVCGPLNNIQLHGRAGEFAYGAWVRHEFAPVAGVSRVEVDFGAADQVRMK